MCAGELVLCKVRTFRRTGAPVYSFELYLTTAFRMIAKLSGSVMPVSPPAFLRFLKSILPRATALHGRILVAILSNGSEYKQ